MHFPDRVQAGPEHYSVIVSCLRRLVEDPQTPSGVELFY